MNMKEERIKYIVKCEYTEPIGTKREQTEVKNLKKQLLFLF